MKDSNTIQNVNTFLSPYLISILVSVGIGLIIGLEREFRKATEKDHFAGIRTFPLVCLLGCIIKFIGSSISPWLTVVALAALIIFIVVAYYVRSAKGHAGMTTEVSLIITFVLGMMSAEGFIRESLAATVITTTLLALKGQFHSFVLKITQDELFAFIKFIVLCLLLFPFLPDIGYGPNGIINPQEIGFIIVVVSAISFVGYMLVKFSGTSKGILLTALFGGMVSSTAVSWMFASRSRKADPHQTNLYATGIVLASSIMFLRVIVVAFIFNRNIAIALIFPCLLMFLCGLVFSLFLFKKSEIPTDYKTAVELGNPLNILNALGFGALYVAIAYLVLYAEKYFGNLGLMISGFIAGLADVDAITINMAKLQDGLPGLNISSAVVVLATLSNTLVKLMIAVFQGKAELRKKVGVAFGTIILVALIVVLLQLSRA